ncbi:MAG: xylulokinase [Planctomycetota bacterium]
MENLILALDIGTTSVKAVIFDKNGCMVAKGLQEYDLEKPAPDIVELEVEVYWESVRAAVGQVLKAAPEAGKNIKAVGVTSQAETLIVLDKEGSPLRKAIVWLDNRSEREAAELTEKFSIDKVYEITGQQEIVPTWTATKILWLRNNEPDIFAAAHKYLMVSDYIIYRLTGAYFSCGGLNPSTLYFDIRENGWWQEMLDFLDISEDKLPQIVSAGEETASVNCDIGISKTAVVTAAPIDQVAAAVGAGNTEPGMITETTGSALAICATLNKLTYLPEKQAGIYLHALQDKYILLPWVPAGGMVLRWFRDEFCAESDYETLGNAAGSVAAGSEGLILLPHLAGAVCPEVNENARGVFYGISLAHKREHFTRAIMESVAYILKDNIEMLESVGIKDESISSLGGAASSKLWLQIKADVLDKQIKTMKCSEATCLGTAIIAAKGARLYNTLTEAGENMVKEDQVIDPEGEGVAVYQSIYQKYKDLNSKLLPTFGG